MDPFERGVMLFNQGDFFRAHEVWEGLWRNAGDDKKFLQGLIQIAAGFYHYGKGNHPGAIMMLERGMSYINQYPENHLSVDTVKLLEQVQKSISCIKQNASYGYPLIILLGRNHYI